MNISIMKAFPVGIRLPNTGRFAAIVAIGAVLYVVAAAATAQSSLHLAVVAGQGQTTVIGQPFPTPLAVRLTTSLGSPISGATIYFANDGCFTYSAPGSPSTCPYTGAPGHFDSGALDATVVTDAYGIATAPTYVAGAAPGSIGVYAYAPPNVAPYYFDYSSSLNNIVVLELTQTAASVAIPAISVPVLIITAIMLSAFGLFAIRMRVAG